MRVVLCGLLLGSLWLVGSAWAYHDGDVHPLGRAEMETPQPESGLLGNGVFGPWEKDAYGPGVHRDATGRAFIWRPDDPHTLRDEIRKDRPPSSLREVTPGVYGPGTGMDQYGRAVRPACPLGRRRC